VPHLWSLPPAVSLAKSHLRDGRDVVVPQLVTIFDKGNLFEAAAAELRARFVEVALLVDIEEHTRRLAGKEPASDVEAWIQSRLEADDLMEKIRGHLAEYLRGRPDTIQLDTTGLSIDQTYVRLTNLLST
jgi:hypothetical protein